MCARPTQTDVMSHFGAIYNVDTCESRYGLALEADPMDTALIVVLTS